MARAKTARKKRHPPTRGIGAFIILLKTWSAWFILFPIIIEIFFFFDTVFDFTNDAIDYDSGPDDKSAGQYSWSDPFNEDGVKDVIHFVIL